MEKNRYTRRAFLLRVSLMALGMLSWVSYPQASSERQAFTFVQLYDTQLGMGGYEHDLKTLTGGGGRLDQLFKAAGGLFVAEFMAEGGGGPAEDFVLPL